MIKAVAFDLDGTLFDRDNTVAQVVNQQYQRYEAVLTHIRRADYVERFLQFDAHGYVPKDVVYQQLVQEFAIKEITPQALFDDFLMTYHSDCLAFPGMVEALTTLRQRGLRLGIITNGTAALQMGVIRVLGIESFFGTILVSETEGIRKPDRTIFDRAAERLEVPAQACIFVGDHSVIDIQGAQNAGWKAIWKRNTVWNVPNVADATIDGLDELEGAIEACSSDSILVRHPLPLLG